MASLPNQQDTSKRHIDDLAVLVSSLGLKSSGKGASEAKPLDVKAAQELAAKISEILGGSLELQTVNPNDAGQVLNEEGLPVVDISEEITAVPQKPSDDLNPLPIPLVPLSSLSESARAQRRRRVERLFDVLEEEEAALELKAAASSRRASVETREREKERAQENMARALANTAAAVSAGHVPTAAASPPAASMSNTEVAPTKPPKRVMFADNNNVQELLVTDTDIDLGDVVLSRLKGSSERKSVNNPMKFQGVELAASSRPAGASTETCIEDSDDEPSLGTDEDGNFLIPHSANKPGEKDEDSEKAKSDDDDNSYGDSYEEEVEDDDVQSLQDMNEAMLRREVAFEYYRKRESLAPGGSLSDFGRIAVPVDNWEEEMMAEEATLAGTFKKPSSISRFKSSRLARSFLPAETEGGQSWRSKGCTENDMGIGAMIRQGKLDSSGQLVISKEDELGEDGIGPRGEDIIEALRTGQNWQSPADIAHSLGPDPRKPPLVLAASSPTKDVPQGSMATAVNASHFQATQQITAVPSSYMRSTATVAHSAAGRLPPAWPASGSRTATSTKRVVASDDSGFGHSSSSATSPSPTASGSNGSKPRISRFKAERAARG